MKGVCKGHMELYSIATQLKTLTGGDSETHVLWKHGEEILSAENKWLSYPSLNLYYSPCPKGQGTSRKRMWKVITYWSCRSDRKLEIGNPQVMNSLYLLSNSSAAVKNIALQMLTHWPQFRSTSPECNIFAFSADEEQQGATKSIPLDVTVSKKRPQKPTSFCLLSFCFIKKELIEFSLWQLLFLIQTPENTNLWSWNCLNKSGLPTSITIAQRRRGVSNSHLLQLSNGKSPKR